MKTRMKLRMKRTPKRYIRREPRCGVLVVVVDLGWGSDGMRRNALFCGLGRVVLFSRERSMGCAGHWCAA